jgi:uncharacterized protein (DUF433 family)
MTLSMAFSTASAARLTGLSEDRVRYWAETGVLSPSLSNEPDIPFGRVYAFRDLVGLRTLALLRDCHQFSLQQLRQIGRQLAEQYQEPWSTLRFYVAGDRLLFSDAERDALVATEPPGQTLFQEIALDLDAVATDLSAATRRVRERRSEDRGQVTQQRNVVQNQPVVKGTRIPVGTIQGFYRAGFSAEDILREFPALSRDDVEAALLASPELAASAAS